MSIARSFAWLVVVGSSVLTGCGGTGESAPSTTVSETPAPVVATTAPAAGPGTAPDVSDRCLVRLHGKGGAGGDTVVEDGVAVIAPTGNADGWGGRQWLYFPDDEYEAAREIVAGQVAPCGRVIVDGFSNGAAFAAKLYCRGETFDGRLVRVVVDDPVVDQAVEGCSPDPSVDVALYWTGELEATAQPGWDCTEGDWTCEGGTTIGIDAYAAALGTDVKESPYDVHEWYLDAPELADW